MPEIDTMTALSSYLMNSKYFNFSSFQVIFIYMYKTVRFYGVLIAGSYFTIQFVGNDPFTASLLLSKITQKHN